jgi:hypothetical protein
MTRKKGPGSAAARREKPSRQPPAAPSWSWLHRILLLALFLVAALLSLRQVGSADIGFHLRTGDYILGGHGFPRTDPFTETMSAHRYTDTSWGYDVLVALLYRMAGPAGLVLFHAGLVLLVFFLLLRTTRLVQSDPTSLVLLLLAGVVAMEFRFETRPELVSYALLAVLLYLLHRHAEGRACPLWAIPVVMLVWSNMHSLYVIGWLVMVAFVLGLWWARRRFDHILFRWCLLGVLVAFLNPYGWQAVAFPFSLLTRFGERNPFSQTIGEFVSPFALRILEQFPFYPMLPIWTFRILAVLSLPAAVILFRQRRMWMVLLWLAVFPLSAKMLRNVPLFLVVMLPGMAWTLSFGRTLAWFRVPARRRNLMAQGLTTLGIVFALGLGLRVVHNAYYIDTRRLERFGLGWSDMKLPLEAAQYARTAHPPGAMLNHLNFGGYLLWALPEPAFIDGRLEVVGESFYAYYLNALHAESGLEECVARYHIGWIVFPYLQEMDLLRRLSKDPRWTLTHVDPLAAVFVRRSGDAPAPTELIPPPDVRLESLPGLGGTPRPGRWARWLRGFVAMEEFPFAAFQRGLFHTIRGEKELAAGWLAEAVRESNGAYYEIYLNLAQVLERMGQKNLAQEAYRVVLQDDPQDRIARRRLATR